MKGFHFKGAGRRLTADNQVLASMLLDGPGTYIVFSKAFVTIEEGNGNHIKAHLVVDNTIYDEMEFDLIQNQQTSFSVVLNCAVEFDNSLNAQLVFHIVPGVSPVIVRDPRLSAIQVSEIGVTQQQEPTGFTEPSHPGPF